MRFVQVGLLHAVNACAEPMLAVWWPVLQAALLLTSGGLTLLQLCLPGGLWLGAFAGTWMASRLGTRRAIVVGALGFFGGLPFVVAWDAWVLAGIALVVVGFCNGVYDVVQNTQTSELEVRGRRRHMLAFKAVFSVTAFVAASAAGLVVGLGVGALASLVGTAVVALAIVLPVVLHGLPDIRPAQPAPGAAVDVDSVRDVQRKTRGLALLAVMGALPLGVIYTQGALLFADLGAPGGFRATGLAVFSLAQAVVQLALWWWSKDLDPRLAAVVGGCIAVLGASLVVGAVVAGVGWVLAAVGIFLLGAGVASVSPMAQSVAGQRFPAQRAAAVGSVTRLNHVGIAFAPAVVFVVALLLPRTLGIAVVLLVCPLVVALFAARVYRPAGG